jgi:cytoskeletal protein RodZ
MGGAEPPVGSVGRDGFGPRVPLDNFDSDFPPNRPGTPKPQILAPQANEWADGFQEVEVVKSRRTGLVLLFLLALLVVILIALGLALLSVVRSGDDVPEATGTADSSIATEQDGTSDGDGGDGTDGAATSLPVTETTVDPNALQLDVTEDPFICNGEARAFAQLSGAEPSEEITFVSPQSPDLRSAAADANGQLPIRWSCDPEQAGTTWELTAAGVTSGKSVTFIFAGAIAAEPTTVPGAPPAALNVVLNENPFACNSEVRVFGRLSGADPGEEIAFTSPQASDIGNGTADENGERPIRWSCGPERVGTSWDLTATGVTSGRTVTFSFSGG